MIFLLFPGQGSQKPGMAKDLVEAFPAAREAFDRADAALGTKLGALCFEGPAEELTLTHNAQPALLAHGAAVWAVVKDKVSAKVQGAAGHSLGEFSAYHAAGALPLEDAIRLVVEMGTASTSMLQRRMRLGYTRAGRMMDMLERRGVISGYEGSKPRQVLITSADLPRVLGGGDPSTAHGPADDAAAPAVDAGSGEEPPAPL